MISAEIFMISSLLNNVIVTVSKTENIPIECWHKMN